MQTLLVSNIALWVIVVLLGVAIYSLTRLVREFLEQSRSRSAEQNGLQVGEVAPPFSERSVDGRLAELNQGQDAFLLFTTSTCSVCEHLLDEVVEQRDHLPKEAEQLIVLNDSSKKDVDDWVGLQLRNSRIRVVSHTEVWRKYRVKAVPLLMVVSNGRVARTRNVASWEQLRGELQASATDVFPDKKAEQAL